MAPQHLHDEHIEAKAQRAYWGKHLETMGEIPQKHRQYLGCEEVAKQEVKQSIAKYAEDETNSRKILAKARGAYGRGQNPEFPAEEDVLTGPATTAYTDGGLTIPDRKWWSMGGFGIWWPGVEVDDAFLHSFSDQGCAHIRQKEDCDLVKEGETTQGAVR